MDELLVRDIGEQGLLARLQSFCPAEIVGDDGAILPIAPNCSIVVTTDVLVDGVHFSDRTTSPFDVGWRAVAANLSDIAAMGAKPLGITVGLSIPRMLAISWIEEVYEGMSACLATYCTPLAGGDICRSTVVSLAITALGEVSSPQAICRHNARSGDAIVATGLHGLSRGGLELLLNPELADLIEVEERSRLIEAHQRPKPRLDVLPHLREIAPDMAIAGMDSSDGMADAVRQICHRSGVGARLDRSQIALDPSLIKLVGAETAWSWALHGGEDFELILCLPKLLAHQLVARLGSHAAIIGKITATPEIVVVDPHNSTVREFLASETEFQHF